MRILHVTDNYAPAMGGLERYVQILSGALAEHGHEVSVATLLRPGAPEFATDDAHPQVRVLRLGSLEARLSPSYDSATHHYLPPVPDPVFTAHLRRVIRDLAPDVVHSHSWALASVLATRLPDQTALVHTLHEYGLVCAKQTYTREPTGCVAGPAVPRCINCARTQYGVPRAVLAATGVRVIRPHRQRVDRFIAISTAVRDACEIGTAGRPIDVIPTFVPGGLAALADRTAPPTELPAEPFLLFVGALGPHKGVQILAEAWRRLADRPPLVFCGTRRPDSPLLDQRGITVLHDVPHAQVMAAWRRSRIGVVPSVWPEPFGQVAVEGMALGTPMVLSDTGGLSDIAGAGKHALLVPPGDTEALARALERLLIDKELSRRLAAGGPTRAAGYEITRVLPEVLDCYDRARSGRSMSHAAHPESRVHRRRSR